MKNSMTKAAVGLCLIFASGSAVSAFAGEAEGMRLLAVCVPDVARKIDGPMVLVYNLNDVTRPWYQIVVSWMSFEGPRKGYTKASVYAPAKVFTVPGEEIHFEAPGFRMEVVTSLAKWSDGDLPGTDAARPEEAFANLWTTAGPEVFRSAWTRCEFKR